MIRNLKENLKTNIINMRGWHTNRKLLVLESDDWGSIRVSSKNAYDKFLKAGIPVDKCPYNSNDSLESNMDLENLFEQLCSIKDSNGNHAVLTANNIVANPDFEKIKASGYTEYHYEIFTETLKHYPQHNRVIDLYKEGIGKGIFIPQFHGREHININNWFNYLQKGDKPTLMAFDQNMFTIARGVGSLCRNENLDGFGTYSLNQLTELQNIIVEGCNIFEKLWGYKSKSVIAPCYIWHPIAEKYFSENGIEFIQSGRVQLIPGMEGQALTYKRKFTGQKNDLNQIYTIRNVTFEPVTDRNKDWVDSCLNEISVAFRWKKPAIVSTHRVNYIGSINKVNSEKNLLLLKKLLQEVKNRWPDIEFVSSAKMGEIIKSSETL